MEPGFDYVIVGGGSAGCVLAARLTENSTIRVCLIEAGGRDTNPLIHVPVGFAKMTTGPLTWGLTTAPQRHVNNREIPFAQARVLGGGSSINAQVFTRGIDRQPPGEGLELGQPAVFLVGMDRPAAERRDRTVRRAQRVLGQVPAGLEAAIDQAPRLQLLQRGLVVRQMLGLPAHRLFPGQAQPGEVVENRRLVFRAAACRVDVFEAQQEPPSGLLRRRIGGQGRKGVPAMQAARRRRGETGDERGAHWPCVDRRAPLRIK